MDEVIKRVLRDGEKEKSGVDEIILVGGSTRIPIIQQRIKDFFNGKVAIVLKHVVKSNCNCKMIFHKRI